MSCSAFFLVFCFISLPIPLTLRGKVRSVPVFLRRPKAPFVEVQDGVSFELGVFVSPAAHQGATFFSHLFLQSFVLFPPFFTRCFPVRDIFVSVGNQKRDSRR